MAVEIERRFIVKRLPFETDRTPGTSITQGYLAPGGPYSVRVRLTPEGCYLTAKSDPGLERQEVEIEVPRVLAEALIYHCGDRVISKIRHPIIVGDRLWVIDVFRSRNSGLVMAEVELVTPHEPIDIPEWCGVEVTDDPRFFNERLAVKPYDSWV